MSAAPAPEERFDDATRVLIEGLFSEGDFREIESILGRKRPNAGIRGALVKATWHYLRDRERPVPRSKNLRTRLTTIRDAASVFQSALAPIVGDAGADVLEAGDVLLWLTQWGLVDQAVLDSAFLGAVDIADAANSTLRDLPDDTGGRASDYHHHALVAELAVIYRRAVGRKPTVTTGSIGDHYGRGQIYGGKFLRLAAIMDRVISTATETKPKTNAQLGAQLKRQIAKALSKTGAKPARKSA